jgi:hypothetical protein
MEARRLVVGLGKTSRPSDAEEWTKEYYELETVVDDLAQLETVHAEMKARIQGWLSDSKPASKPAAMPSQPLPQLDPDELVRLPWKTYKTKEDCRPDEAGWIFRNTPGAEALAHLIETQGKDAMVQIGPNKFDVKFSGAEKQFIGRAPSK